MEPRIQCLRGAIVVIGAIVFTMVAYAASTRPDPAASCLTREQVREALERSRNGIALDCNETIRQRNLQALEHLPN